MSLDGNVENGVEQIADTPVEQVEEFYGSLEEFQGKEATEQTETVEQPEAGEEPENAPEQKEEKLGERELETPSAKPFEQETVSRADFERVKNGLLATIKNERQKRKEEAQKQDSESDFELVNPEVVARRALEIMNTERTLDAVERAVNQDSIGVQFALQAVEQSPYLQERLNKSHDKGEELLNIARVDKSMREAREKYGEEFYKAVQFVDSREDLSHKLFSAKEPGEELINLYKKEAFFSDYEKASDRDAFILQEAAKIQARTTTDQPTIPERQQQATPLPKPSLAKATGLAPTKPLPPENAVAYAFGE